MKKPVLVSLIQGRSQDFISTEAKGKPKVWGRSPQRGPDSRGSTPGQGLRDLDLDLDLG